MKERIKAYVIEQIQKEETFQKLDEEQRKRCLEIIEEEMSGLKGGFLGFMNPNFYKKLKDRLAKEVVHKE